MPGRPSRYDDGLQIDGSSVPETVCQRDRKPFHFKPEPSHEPQAAKSAEQIKLGVLVERRRQILDLINQENNRSQQTRDRNIRDSIDTVLKIQDKTARIARQANRGRCQCR